MKTILIVVLILSLTSACPYSWLFGESYEKDVERRLQLEQELQQSTAQGTRDIFWNRIEATKYGSLPTLDGAGLSSLTATTKFALSSMSVPIERVEDTMPAGRVKWIHPLGACGKVKFVANQYSKDGYTGLFQGADHGIARLSLAADPKTDNFSPGMALKFFRNGQISGNIISMFSLDGQGSNFNFFQNTFTNIVAEPSSFALQVAAFLTFRRASSCPTVLALGDFARFDQNGEYKGYLFPNQIYFQPVAETQFSSAYHEFRTDLAQIKNGQRLYTVWVSQQTDGPRRQVGELIAEGPFVASDFCDNQLFFKHQKGEDINCGK